jgi:peptide/nickel transport system ATP-binding protein
MGTATIAPLLSMTDVTKVYQSGSSLFGKTGSPVVALDHISLDINPGEIFGLVGESGSGKTTASRLILGLETPDSGRIQLDGHNIVGLKGRTRLEFTKQVQVIFQDPYQSLNAHFSIFDTVCEPLIIHGIGDRVARRIRVCEALETAGLTPPEMYLERYPHQLSGGQRQRVAIARAVIMNPTVILADEPTGNLDRTSGDEIIRAIESLREQGMTVLIVTHDPHIGGRAARAIRMVDGRIVSDRKGQP